MQPRPKGGRTMDTLDGKVAVITGGDSGIGLAAAKRLVADGAYVFITGRRQRALDDAVKQIGQNVTAVGGGASRLAGPRPPFSARAGTQGPLCILFSQPGGPRGGPPGG